MSITKRIEQLEKMATTTDNSIKMILIASPDLGNDDIAGIIHDGQEINRKNKETLLALEKRAVAKWYKDKPIICTTTA
jgi:hypothetical protein